MPYFAPTALVLKANKALIVSGPHFHLFDSSTGDLVCSSARLDNHEQLNKSGPIRCTAIHPQLLRLATTGDDKKLKVWTLADTPELTSERELPKKPTEVAFTGDGQTIVTSDKFGDVFSYPLVPQPLTSNVEPSVPTSKRGSLTAHENPSNGSLVLGHASMLTTFLLTPDEKYIITTDRDEHIRVSWFPQGYVIERYCLGHEKFVSAIHIPSFQPDVLVSGGGDPILKVWDWMSGKLLADIAVSSTVEPYIKVKTPKKRRGQADGDGGEGEGEGGNGAQRTEDGKGKSRRRRRKGKGAGKAQPHEESEGGENPSAEADPADDQTMLENVPAEEHVQVLLPAPEEVVVLVVHRISSVDRGEHGRFIVFNAVGATAIFYTPFPEGDHSTSTPAVHAVDIGVPVIDFTVGPDGDLWTLVDAQWTGVPDTPSEDPQSVRLLQWNGANLVEPSNPEAPLLAALNAACRIPATPKELKTLDLYSDLSSLPKNVDPDHDPLIRDTLSEAAAMDPETDGKQMTQRELGRLKKKKALLAKIQEKEQQKRGASEAGDAEAAIEAEAGREIKKTRSESDGASEVGRDVQDVEMDAS
ncbi:WD40-repeat-containing domain protein [Daedaleopsis nitida]|nr:WD40-repeat-containing domain protein [Daedaleopsis nitida]